MPEMITLDNLNKEILKYIKQKEEFSELFLFYKGIMEVVLKYMNKINIPFDLDEEEIKSSLRGNTHLIAVKKIEVDETMFEEIKEKITALISQRDNAQGSLLKKIWGNSETKAKKLITALDKSGGFTPESLQHYFEENGIIDKDGDNFEVISFVVFSALMPFYMDYAEKAARVTDFALWSGGNCPVCGQKPLMAKIRKEDSARILECWLCHTQWGFPRLECPFCDNKDHRKLRYFYIDEIKGRRVNVCEKCKSYIKASSLKEIGSDVILDLENLFTIQLDSVAQKEGYLPGKDLYLLN